MQRRRQRPASELPAWSEPWLRACQPPRRAARAAWACTEASSSGERPVPSHPPGFDVGAGGMGRSGPKEWKRWGEKRGSIAPSVAAPRTSSQCQMRGTTRVPGPDQTSKRTAVHAQDPCLLMLADPSHRRGWTHTYTQQRPAGRESAAMGGVALPSGGFLVGHTSRGKQSSLPGTGGLVGWTGAYIYLGKHGGVAQERKCFLSLRSRMGCFLT